MVVAVFVIVDSQLLDLVFDFNGCLIHSVSSDLCVHLIMTLFPPNLNWNWNTQKKAGSLLDKRKTILFFILNTFSDFANLRNSSS